jgi:hypothetical protein
MRGIYTKLALPFMFAVFSVLFFEFFCAGLFVVHYSHKYIVA